MYRIAVYRYRVPLGKQGYVIEKKLGARSTFPILGDVVPDGTLCAALWARRGHPTRELPY